MFLHCKEKAVPNQAENQYRGGMTHYYHCNVRLELKCQKSSDMPPQNLYFLYVQLLSLHLPTVTVIPEIENFFSPASKITNTFEPVGSSLSYRTTFTAYLFFPRMLAAHGLMRQLFEGKTFLINQQIAKGKKHQRIFFCSPFHYALGFEPL